MDKRYAVFTVLVISITYAWHKTRKPEGENMTQLRYFTAAEFGEWWPFMNPALLAKIDRFRDLLGFAVALSPAPGAIGRRYGSTTSRHYYAGSGDTVDAVDVMPIWPNGGTPAELERAYKIAQQVGFTGIGLAPQWKPRAGLHVDVGQRTRAASWGYIATSNGQKTVTAEQAIASA